MYGLENNLQEQGVDISVISQFSKLKINSLKYSIDYEPLIINLNSFGNFIFYEFGCVGVYKLLRFFEISRFHSLLIINLLNIPILGARIILKPEIVAFAYLPWCVFAIYKFLFSKNFKYLFVIIPIVSILLTSKASISLMIALSLLIFIKKDFLSLKIIPIVILTLLVSLVLINESQVFNNKFLWEHTTPEGYDNVAPGNFIFTINNDLMSNPYRDSQANSMIGILLVDTFGDYWQRYWYHQDAWQNNQHPGSLLNTRIGILLSLGFYVYLGLMLLKEQNKNLKKFGSLFLLGIATLLVNIFNIFPFLTKISIPTREIL